MKSPKSNHTDDSTNLLTSMLYLLSVFGVMLDYEKLNSLHRLIAILIKCCNFKQHVYLKLDLKNTNDKNFIFVRAIFYNSGVSWLIQSDKQA